MNKKRGIKKRPHFRKTFLLLHGRRDSNSRHLVLETSALPTELHPCLIFATANIIIHSKLPKQIYFSSHNNVVKKHCHYKSYQQQMALKNP